MSLHLKNLSHKEDKTIYIICNLKKLKKDAVTGLEEENERDETYKADNPQIDNSRTKYNYHLATPSGKYLDVIEGRIANLNLKRKVRSDAVYLVSLVLGASPEFFKVSTTEKQYAFFHDCVKFFQDKYGEENVLSAVVHLDETTPHLHLNLIPIVNGKLCAKDLFDRQLAILQTEIWKEVGVKYGLDRGKPNSQTEHRSTAEYKAMKILEAAEQRRTEVEEYSEALQQAEQGEIAHSESGMRKQIVAVTAKNVNLKRRLTKSMQETLDVDKENKQLKEYKIRAAKALSLLAKLERENPEAYNALFETKQKAPASSSKNWWAK